jgi:UDP-GlcNAc:undecaprenyl-phosphate GlcNAc-1-phosphate transferase
LTDIPTNAADAFAHAAAAGAAGMATLLVCLAARPIGDALGLMDAPDGRRKLHARPTPLVGGLAVLAGLLAGLTAFAAVAMAGGVPTFVVMAGGLVLAGFAVGLADDRRAVPPWIRLGGLGAIAALTAVLQPDLNVRVLDWALFDLYMGLWWFSIPFTVFALLCLQNGLNMADGVDGLAASIVLVWLLLILPFGLAHAPGVVPVLAAAIASVAIVAAVNWTGRLFLGDAGTYGLSLLAGTLGIYVYTAAQGAIPAELVGLWFAIPVLDMGRVMATRTAAGRNPFEGARDHFHHRMLQLFGRRLAVLVYLALVGLPPAAVWQAPALLGPAIVTSAGVYVALLWLARRREAPASGQVAGKGGGRVL